MTKSERAFSIIHPAKFPFFYGWIVLAVGAVGFLMTSPGQTIGVSAFTDSLLDVLRLSRDELSMAYMGGTVIGALALTKAGQFFDKFGAVRTALIASMGLAIGVLYLSQVDVFSSFFGSKSIISMICVLVGFVVIRFFGQGVLTLACRTMVVKWFDARRGLAIGILSMFAAFGFSIAPVVFDSLINQYDWSGAWIFIAILTGLVFPIFVFLFFKNTPESYGLLPDGYKASKTKGKKEPRFPTYKDFTLPDARATLSLWVFSCLPAFFGMVSTGFTFHVVSVFDQHDLGREIAINIFQPIAVVSVISSIFFSWLSDYIRLKYMALFFATAALVAMFGLSQLSAIGFYYWLFIISYGLATGIHPLILSLFLPRFFGKTHLGAITGQAMTVIVFASAFGPILFSLSLSRTGSYQLAEIICGIGFICLFIGALLTQNPQLRFADSKQKA